MNRQYVQVDCTHLSDGIIIPRSITWDDGRSWKITRVLHTCTSPEGEFEGTRYTVRIGNREKYLYFTDGKWCVERSGKGNAA